MQLKRWESPRREGRNDKGKGGAARRRQLKKQRQMLRQRLKENGKSDNGQNKERGKKNISSPFFWLILKILTKDLLRSKETHKSMIYSSSQIG